jgi:hypothetical protein
MRLLFSIHCVAFVFALQTVTGQTSKPTLIAPPALPTVKSPVESLRELLEMKPSDRANALTNKSEKYRKVIEGRLKELDDLSPDQREARLRLMQLRWELLPLLSSPTQIRTTMVTSLPQQDQPLIRQRLEYWDKLPSDVQKLVLTNEMVMHYFITGQASTTNALKERAEAMAPLMRGIMLTNIQHWRALTADQQRQAYDVFRQIFDLSPKERERLFAEKAERERMERFLKAYEKLPSEDRERLMKSFQKFTTMSTEQRLEFLKNARRWEAMSESDKEAWRTMIKSAPPVPPLPERFFPTAVATNASFPAR